ncbi:MAG TPA: bifunctional phosphopantothenoylcysteine decarboxylase/phosphopantothenate--cysteine ligase CoaBC [Chloroflexia bacterium]|nr:bifunctional phosphopantothenoylcysteine decarboxylase/phosphopantothenate--cysteine ligase CoaBC [Chloroflexia bacterium]
MKLQGKNILLGVAGGIAAYKVVQVARDLTVAGAKVHVLMTPAATRFVTPLTFQALTRQKVYTDIWEGWTEEDQGHISLAREADLALIAPATGDILARLALGLADDVITTTMLGLPRHVPVLLAPAMETHMYEHPATRQHLQTLVEWGAQVIEPGYGRLASGAVGTGRMAEPAQLVAAVRLALGQQGGSLRGKRLVITAGGTQEAIDPVRYIGNRSSGQMGYALAQEALDRGAEVILISGPVRLDPPYGSHFVSVTSTLEMQHAIHQALWETRPDALIMAAAVADFRPENPSGQKIKKDGSGKAPDIKLTLNPDILAGLKDLEGLDNMLRVGFAAETEQLHQNAEKKLLNKGLDLIIANEAVSSIGQPDNEITMIERGGLVTQLERMPKEAVAEHILDKVSEMLARQSGQTIAVS